MKAAIAIAVVLTTLMMIVPIASEDAEAISQNDYSIVIAGYYDSDHKQVVKDDMSNGQSSEIPLYFYNKCDKDLDIQFTGKSFKDEIRFSSIPESTMVKAHGMARLTFAMSVIETCNSVASAKLEMTVLVTELPDNVTTSEVINFDIRIISEYDSGGAYNKFLGIFENRLPAPFDTSLTPFIVSILVFMVAAYIACIVLVPRLANYFDRMTASDDKKRFEKILSSLVTVSVTLLTINPGLLILGADASLQDLIFRLTMTFFIVAISFTVWVISMYVIENILREYEKEGNSVLDTSLMPVCETLAKIVIAVLAVGCLMYIYGFDIQGILVSAGLITLGITMGARSILAQFFSGISLLLTKRFHQGDRVTINGDEFVVNKVKLMFTEFTNKEKDRVITIPNDSVESSVIVNFDTTGEL